MSKDGCLPGWSPDGKRLALGGQRDDAWTSLWVVDVEKRQGVRIALGPLEMPAWSKDGSTLAFDLHLGDSAEIWMIETSSLASLPPQVPAAGRSSVPEAAERLIGPSHHPKGHLVYVDLQQHGNFKLTQGITDGNHLAELPQGEQTMAGVKFRVGESGIHLGSKRLLTMPSTLEGIPIHRRAIVFYMLHATQWGGPGALHGRLFARDLLPMGIG